jgi:transcriptional antiterminator RfaH
MPILPPEPDMFPEDLLEPGHPTAGDRRWWALYTLPRREKDLVRRLRRHRIHHYCPLVPKRNRSPSGRVRTSHVPLFAGYVFLAGSEDDRYEAMTTNCVSRCLEVPDPVELVRDLRQIRQLVESGAPLTPEARLQPGMMVRVRSGSLAGFEGTVIKRRGTERLLVAVRFLQKGASVELEDCQVERIDG